MHGHLHLVTVRITSATESDVRPPRLADATQPRHLRQPLVPSAWPLCRALARDQSEGVRSCVEFAIPEDLPPLRKDELPKDPWELSWTMYVRCGTLHGLALLRSP